MFSCFSFVKSSQSTTYLIHIISMPILEVQTLSTPDGILRLLHVILGGTSLVLLLFSYVQFWALDVFVITVATCFGISTFNLILNCLFRPTLHGGTTPNKIVGSLFHIIAGGCLIVAGIDLIGWSDYDTHCGFKCTRVYYIGVAKILTFINGTLYGVYGFLAAKGQDDEDFLAESLPLLSPQVTFQIHPPTPTTSTNDIQNSSSYQEYHYYPQHSSSYQSQPTLDTSSQGGGGIAVSDKMGIN